MHVGVVDDVHGLAGLRVEGPDLSIAPAADDALAVAHEADAEALDGRHVDAEDLVSVLRIPDPDVVHGAGGEDV